MYVVTAEEMRRLDEYVIQTMGIPATLLMENAGNAVAQEVISFAKDNCHQIQAGSQKWAVLVGKGNNGADGLVAARHLTEQGIDVDIIYAVPPEQLTGDAGFQRDVIVRLGIQSFVYGHAPIQWETYDGIIDGLIGTGTKGAPRPLYVDIIQEVNRSKRPIISIDIPSGLDPDTGQLCDTCIKATRTVTLAFLKRGLTQYPGLDAAGEVIVRAIGIWPSFAATSGIRTFLLSKMFLEEHFTDSTDQPRQHNSHKGTYGHVLVCAGSHEMSGAGLLCSKAALRTGSGLVTWVVPESLVPSLMGLVPEVMLKGLTGKTHSLNSAEELLAALNTRNVAVIGPGLGRFTDDSRWLRTIWEQSPCPLVLDADALNMIADAADFAEWSLRPHPTILTPHPGEMARLLGVTTAEIQCNRIEIARSFAARHGVILVLKGARTVIATPDGAAYINPTGNPGMATGGSGDVLAGIIAGFIAQGLSADHAACFGVWLHGYAGDQAALKRKSPNSLIAGDIIDEL